MTFKPAFAVAHKTRVEKIDLRQLLALADPQARTALVQTAKKIDMPNIDKTGSARIGGKTAAVIQNARLFLFHVDDDIAQLVPVLVLAGQIGFDGHALESVAGIERLFAGVDLSRAQNVADP